ncbi:DUF5071 domain-containing protein [Marinicellulosiphila megalodicopiae]|uniref:DUF5071 domain-containing protein n=1 Tax=Marinicellulosiphila megalodicopiae TaxID=2724896 RepID=UPI003BB086C1
MMNIIPKNKSDIEAVSNLDNLSNKELEPYLVELLTWVQDINWPVAGYIAPRLSQAGIEIIEPIKQILKSDDATWKYWIISQILPFSNKQVQDSMKSMLIEIINNPTASDHHDEVDLVAKELIESMQNET